MAMNLINIIGTSQVDGFMENGRREAILHIEIITDVLQKRVYFYDTKWKMSLGIPRGGE